MRLIQLLVAVLCVTASSAFAGGPLTYRAVDVGLLAGAGVMIPTGVNDSGVVVGNTESTLGAGYAFMWSREYGLVRLRGPGPGNTSPTAALDINASGQIVGAVSSGGPSGNGGAIVWHSQRGFTYFLEGTWATSILRLTQITNAGEVLGQSYDDFVGGSSVTFPWLWSPKRGLQDYSELGRDNYRAYQMNERRQIVGSYFHGVCNTSAALFDAPTRRLRLIDRRDPDLYCFASIAMAINDHGQVVGFNVVDDAQVPYIWTEAEGIRPLLGGTDPRVEIVTPSDINNAGQVVGRFQESILRWRTSFFYWDQAGGFHDLKDLLDPADPMTQQVVLHAYQGRTNQEFIPKINNRGEILVAGSLQGDNIRDGPSRTFLLVPVVPLTGR